MQKSVSDSRGSVAPAFDAIDLNESMLHELWVLCSNGLYKRKPAKVYNPCTIGC